MTLLHFSPQVNWPEIVTAHSENSTLQENPGRGKKDSNPPSPPQKEKKTRRGGGGKEGSYWAAFKLQHHKLLQISKNSLGPFWYTQLNALILLSISPSKSSFHRRHRYTTSQNSNDPLSVSGKCFERLLNFSATAHLTVINNWWTCSWTVRSLRKYLLCHYRLCDVHASVSASHSALWNFKQRAKQLWPSRWVSICTDTASSVATGLIVPCSHWKII